MKMKSIVVVLNIVIFIIDCVRSTASPPFRGIAPQDEPYYKSASSEFIKCKDGSKTFTIAQLNDDFCDCPDGTDEPGTSACPSGRFYCPNAGHSPKLLFSSRVNDGICDCCDGSDEYDHSVHCPNTCWQAGKAARDKLSKKISTYKDGVSLRNLLIQQAKEALTQDEAELSNLRTQEKTLKALVQQLQEHKEQIEKAEEKERLRKEKQEKELQEAKDKAKQESGDKSTPDDDKIGTFDHALPADSPTNEQPWDQHVEQHPSGGIQDPAPIPESDLQVESKESPSEVINTDNDVSQKTEELSREELGRLVASRWTGENTGKQTEDVNSGKDSNHHEENDVEETIKDSDDEEDDVYASETNDDDQYDDDNVEDESHDDFREEDPEDSSSSYKYESDTDSEFSESTNPSNPSLLDKIQQKLRNILRAVNLFQTPVNQSDAARIRKEYDEYSEKLSKVQSRISSLTKKLKYDFGPDKEFYSFYDKCFEGKESKYVYKVCPYKHASQEEGHSSTRLGRWDKFEDSYKFMIFSNGDKCWNGPDRSLKVKLRCGLKNEVTDVDEPSRCEYVALLSTPALCVEEKVKELEHKLEEMNKDEPQKHDEL